jgi:hypothetical protein
VLLGVVYEVVIMVKVTTLERLRRRCVEESSQKLQGDTTYVLHSHECSLGFVDQVIVWKFVFVRVLTDEPGTGA